MAAELAGGCRVVPATASGPGAIAILQLVGDVEPVLASLGGRTGWPVGRARLTRFGEIDEGIAARLAPGVAQLMPHGGTRVVQRLLQWLADRGVDVDPGGDDPETLFPEAADRWEALALAVVARAASPLAVDLLLAQPDRWRRAGTLRDEDRARSRRLDRLIDPPVVVVAGPANVGKSTLSNALLGRAMSIAADRPGTTRDYTAGRIELAGLVVDWHDTPGLGPARDVVDARALEIAARLIAACDLLVALTDHEQDWPALPRPADLRVANKLDLGRRRDADLSVSALRGDGLADLVTTVRDRLVPPADLTHPGPWWPRQGAAPQKGDRPHIVKLGNCPS